MTLDGLKPERRTTAAVMKLAFIVIAYAVAAVLLNGTVLNLLIDNFHAQVPRVEFTAWDILGALGALPTVGLAIAAWTLRDRWVDLRMPQLFVPVVVMAALTTPVFILILAGLNWLLHFERFSVTTWTITWRILPVVAGLAVAQLLRLRRRSTTSAYV